MGSSHPAARRRAPWCGWLWFVVGVGALGGSVWLGLLPWWGALAVVAAALVLAWWRTVEDRRGAQREVDSEGPRALRVEERFTADAPHDGAAAERPGDLRAVPFTPIARIRDGQLAKFVGQVHLAGRAPLRAPLSGRRCAYYRARVGIPVEPQLFGGRRRRWQTIAEETHSQRFFVEDPTGRALVIVERPRVLVTMRGGFSRHRSMGWRLSAFVERYGRRVGSAELRCEEGLLEPGDPVAVYGRCQWVPDPDPSAPGGHYRARPRRLVVDAPVRISAGGAPLD